MRLCVRGSQRQKGSIDLGAEDAGVGASRLRRRTRTPSLWPSPGLVDPRRPSCRCATWAGFFLGAIGISLVLKPVTLALGRYRVIKKIMKLGADGATRNPGCRQRTGDSLSSLPNLGCAAPCAGCLVVSALEAARGLKVIRGSLDTPSSPCAQVRSLADCCLVPGIRVWKSRSQETGRTTVPGRFRTASSDAPSFSLESLRRLSQKAPENLVRVGQGSGYPQSGFRQGGKRM